MKKTIIVFTAVTILGWMGCGKKAEKTETPAKDTVIVVQPKPSSAPEKEADPDGTDINIDNTGVTIEDKNSGKETDVRIHKDSSSIRIKRPK